MGRQPYKSEERTKRIEALLDLMAPLWSQFSRREMCEILNVSQAALEHAITHARDGGDPRFPDKSWCEVRVVQKPAKGKEGDLPLTVGKAFMREHHPDGNKYTPPSLFRQMSGKGMDDFRRTVRERAMSRTPAPSVSSRELFHMRQSSLPLTEGQLG